MYRFGRMGYIVGRMTKEDDALQDAVIDQLNAEIGATGTNMKDLAKAIGRPYDSTRNYLRKERALPFGVFFEICTALRIPADEVIRRARQRMP